MGRYAIGLVGAVILLAVANVLVDPIPIPAVLAVFGGLIALWLSQGVGLGRVVLGIAVGIALGVLHHMYIHNAGLSPVPEQGLPAHFGINAVLSAAIAAVILLVLAVIDRKLSDQN